MGFLEVDLNVLIHHQITVLWLAGSSVTKR